MRFSIVIPTYNEQNDIAETLDALVSLDYPDKEILVVDDSTDNTPEIVKGYEGRGVRLIRPGGGGRCEARNLGMAQATGEVVCLLNADVRLPSDFLRRIAVHYADGYDYVLVGAKIVNKEHLFARYVAAVEETTYRPGMNLDKMEWTEGFSVRRSVLDRLDHWFPVGFPIAFCAGEDGYFGDQLRRSKARKKVDWSITVEHVCETEFLAYWRKRRERGDGSIQVRRFLQHRSTAWLVTRTLMKTGYHLLRFATVLPVLLWAVRLTRRSSGGISDVPGFLWAMAVEMAANLTGEWRTIRRTMTFEVPSGSGDKAGHSQPRAPGF